MGVSRIRGLTVAGGVALGGLILLATGVLGVIEPDDTGSAPEAGTTDGRAGPLTGVQPALERALLTGNDLPPDGATAAAPPAGPPPLPAATAPPPRPVPGEEEPPAGSGDCRTLFEDPTRLAAGWPSVTARETSARDTAGEAGSVLRQVLNVFDEEGADTAYARLGEAVAGCDRFPALLAGVPVKVLAQELGGDRREGHAVGVTVISEGERLVGWLAVDRIGPVISVLRHLRPEGTPAAGTVAETRQTALSKLRPLLRFLDRDRPGAR